MNFLDKLEKRLGFLAIPNVVATLIVTQLFIYGAILTDRIELEGLLLIPKAVSSGEWWRWPLLDRSTLHPKDPIQRALSLFFGIYFG